MKKSQKHPKPEPTSDLIDQVHHEHQHLRRLFGDLAERFGAISSGDIGTDQSETVIAAAAEELEVALEDMLHHFNQEEEVFFIEIEARHPELKPRIDVLVEAHELMSQRTRWLHEQLGKEPQALARNLEVVVDVLESMAELVETHTREETALFDDVLASIPEGERKMLLRKMREI